MLTYLFVFIFLLFLSFHFDFVEDKESIKYRSDFRKWSRIALLVLICLAGLRNQVGIDTIAYQKSFEMDTYRLKEFFAILENDNEISAQPLWYLGMSIVKIFTTKFFIFQFIVAIVFNLLLFRFLYRTSEKFFLSLSAIFIISWLHLSFEAMRESICVVLYLNSLLSLKDRNIKQFILWAMPACLIHWFAFFPFAITFLFSRYSYRTNLAIIIILSIVLFLLDRLFITENIFNFANLMNSAVSDRVDAYLGIVDNTNVNGIIYSIVTTALAPLLISYLLLKKREDLFASSLLLVIPITVMIFIIPIFYRFLDYFYVIYVVFAINIIFDKQSRHMFSTKIITVLLLFDLCSSAITFYKPSNAILQPSNISYDCRYFPYTTIFQDPNPVREGLY